MSTGLADINIGAYNYEHFTRRHAAAEIVRTISRPGPNPGEAAPDFTLPCAGGGELHLAAMLDRPVLLHFGSYT